MRSKILIFAIVCFFTPAMLVGEPGPPTGAGLALVGAGDVVDSAPNGFSIKIGTVIHAGPSPIYDALVHHIGDWWSSDHTMSHDAHNLSLDDKPMGCFCEKMPNNSGVRFGQVTMVMPDKMLVISAALGPLFRAGATGTLSFVLQPIHNDTRLEVTYNVGGYMSGGLNTWADPVDKVLTEQVTRLKSYIETGSPVPAAGEKKSQ